MSRIERLQYWNRLLLAEMPEYKPQAQRFSQDALLSAEREEQGVVDRLEIPAAAAYPQISIWQRDIIVHDHVVKRDREDLASCCRSCLELAAKHGLKSVAFCCISTGEFHFPNQEAAEIAVKTVIDFLRQNTSIKKVIFNVFKDTDAEIYRRLLGPDRTAEAGA